MQGERRRSKSSFFIIFTILFKDEKHCKKSQTTQQIISKKNVYGIQKLNKIHLKMKKKYVS